MRSTIKGQAREVRQVVVDLDITLEDPVDSDTEVVLLVNGRPLRRLTPYQAERLGIVSKAVQESRF